MCLIYYNVMLKITRLQDMFSFCKNTLKLANFDEYSNSESFTKLGGVVNDYFTKYKVIFNDKWNSQFGSNYHEFQSDSKFNQVFSANNVAETKEFYNLLQGLVVKAVLIINKTLKETLKSESQELSKNTEGGIILLDYLVTFYQLTQVILDNFENYTYFSQVSKVNQIAEGKPVRLSQ